MTVTNNHKADAGATVGDPHITFIEARRYEAMLRSDTDALAAMLADDMIYTHSDGSQDGKAEYLQKVADGSYRYRSIDHGVSQVVKAGDALLVHGWMRASVDVHGETRSLDNVSLAIWSAGAEPQLIAYASTAIRRR